MATTNPWKQFSELLPKPARIIGTVINHISNGTSSISLRSGQTMTAKGQGVAVGSRVLVENGEIMREVSELPVYNAQV